MITGCRINIQDMKFIISRLNPIRRLIPICKGDRVLIIIDKAIRKVTTHRSIIIRAQTHRIGTGRYICIII